jgi:hypothetical protein
MTSQEMGWKSFQITVECSYLPLYIYFVYFKPLVLYIEAQDKFLAQEVRQNYEIRTVPHQMMYYFFHSDILP